MIDIVFGRIIPSTETKRIPSKETHRLDRYDESHYYLMGYPEYFINHSCDPNVYVKKGTIIALKSIKKGEEVVLDYSMNDAEKWRMTCHCGSTNCRRIVYGSFSRLPARIQRRYSPYLDDWFRKWYRRRLGTLNRAEN